MSFSGSKDKQCLRKASQELSPLTTAKSDTRARRDQTRMRRDMVRVDVMHATVYSQGVIVALEVVFSRTERKRKSQEKAATTWQVGSKPRGYPDPWVMREWLLASAQFAPSRDVIFDLHVGDGVVQHTVKLVIRRLWGSPSTPEPQPGP